MKKLAIEFSKSMGTATLNTVKIASIGTLGLASSIVGTANNFIVAGCNNGINKLKGRKTSFNKCLIDVHDYQHVANHIMDGRVSLVEAYDKLASEDFKRVLEYLSHPYREAAMDINAAKS